MTSVTVSRDFRITIPCEVRLAMGIYVGQQLQVLVHDERIVLLPLRPIHELRGFLAGIDTQVERRDSAGDTLQRARAIRTKTAETPVTDDELTVAKVDDRP